MQYVIMLDKDRDSFPEYWAIARQRDSLEEIRAEQDHMGNPMRIPKASARMELLEAKTLMNSETGSLDTGAIYREWIVG